MRTAVRVVLCAAGLLVSVYLTALHYNTHVPLVCSSAGIVNCESVLTSPQSSWFDLPVALFGVLWFLVMGGLVAAASRSAASPRIDDACLTWSLVGTAAVAYLVYSELGIVGRICIWCTAVHLIVVALFLMQALQPRST